MFTLSLSSRSALALALLLKTPWVCGAIVLRRRNACNRAGGGVPLHSRVNATPNNRPPRRSNLKPRPGVVFPLKDKRRLVNKHKSNHKNPGHLLE